MRRVAVPLLRLLLCAALCAHVPAVHAQSECEAACDSARLACLSAPYRPGPWCARDGVAACKEQIRQACERTARECKQRCAQAELGAQAVSARAPHAASNALPALGTIDVWRLVREDGQPDRCVPPREPSVAFAMGVCHHAPGLLHNETRFIKVHWLPEWSVPVVFAFADSYCGTLLTALAVAEAQECKAPLHVKITHKGEMVESQGPWPPNYRYATNVFQDDNCGKLRYATLSHLGLCASSPLGHSHELKLCSQDGSQLVTYQFPDGYCRTPQMEQAHVLPTACSVGAAASGSRSLSCGAGSPPRDIPRPFVTATEYTGEQLGNDCHTSVHSWTHTPLGRCSLVTDPRTQVTQAFRVSCNATAYEQRAYAAPNNESSCEGEPLWVDARPVGECAYASQRKTVYTCSDVPSSQQQMARSASIFERLEQEHGGSARHVAEE